MGWTRREAIRAAAASLAGSAVFGRALAALGADAAAVTPAMVRDAAWVAGLDLGERERALMLAGLEEMLADFAKLRAVPLDNAVAPAIAFTPRRGGGQGGGVPRRAIELRYPQLARPQADEDLAFASLPALGAMLRSRQISSRELTRFVLDRLCRLDRELHGVITFTEDLALAQADRADREIAVGHWRGPLHGIPWAAKDLLAVAGYPTTWGAGTFRSQVRPETATVATRLEDAGAVLVAKTAVGELAWGDVWFGGTTRNPWRLDEGSSGSSAGSAAAVAAGGVPFAIGTETWGSIVSPCTRCGVTGLRPTFGRVSRHGAMALAWTMDKVGAIARSAEDTALVFAAIHGADPYDAHAADRPFAWPPPADPRRLRVGYAAALFESDRTKDAPDAETRARLREAQEIDNATLATLRALGFALVPIALPDAIPVTSLTWILVAEAATAFDELTRSGRDRELVRQIADAWPTVFRQGQLVPAVEYLRANRVRTLLASAMDEALREVDVWVAPSFGGDVLLATNLTGHPCVVVPNGFLRTSGTPNSISFLGRIDGDDQALAVAHAFQEATDFHLRRPPVGG